ncbi:MAG: glycosyltransferase family 2 protein [Candidatus Micrarchaeia archaeon]
MFPMVSIIILNYNGKAFLYNCLSSVLKTDYPNFEVIFVDNGSTDDSVEYVKKNFGEDSRLKMVALDKNYGFAEGNNIGFKYVNPESKYVVFLNNDTIVDSKWLIEAIKILEKDNLIGAAQPKLKSLKDSKRIDSAGGFLDYMGRVYIRGTGEKDVGQYDQVDEIFYAQGAAIIIRKDLIYGIGLFDPEYFINYEETDFCWRTWLSGYKVIFIPQSIVYHWGGATIHDKNKGKAKSRYKVMYHSRKNQLATLIKNYSLSNLFKYLPLLVTRMLGYIIILIIKSNKEYALAYLKALIWNLKNMKKLMVKRIFIQTYIRRKADEEVMKRMLSCSKFERLKPFLKLRYNFWSKYTSKIILTY